MPEESVQLTAAPTGAAVFLCSREEGFREIINPKFTGIFSNYFLPLMPMESCRTEPMIPSVV